MVMFPGFFYFRKSDMLQQNKKRLTNHLICESPKLPE